MRFDDFRMIGGLLLISLALAGCSHGRFDYNGMNGILPPSPNRANGSLANLGACACEIPEKKPLKKVQSAVTKGTVFTLEDVLFDFDAHTLSPEGIKEVNKVALHLHNNPTFNALVEGHADNRGSHEYNRRLSRRRAESVQKALIATGILDARVEMRYYGETQPIADNSTEKGRQRNRRVNITIK